MIRRKTKTSPTRLISILETEKTRLSYMIRQLEEASATREAALLTEIQQLEAHIQEKREQHQQQKQQN